MTDSVNGVSNELPRATSHDMEITEKRGPEKRGQDLIVRQAILRKLSQQGIGRQGDVDYVQEDRFIYPETVDMLSKPMNWITEIKKASSSIKPGANGEPTLLSIDSADIDSILPELGLMPGDTLVLVDGNIPYFSPRQGLNMMNQLADALERLAQGGTASVTIQRNHQIKHIVFHLW